MNSIFENLVPLIAEKSDITDPERFQSVINVVFHDHEAKYYDSLHTEMWESLPQQYELFANDIAPYLKNKTGLKLLDIGCGTGLATQLLLNTAFNNHIGEIHLLDTSSVMLAGAAKRSKSWGKKVKPIHGDVSILTDQYDVIIISSVLHHIPDLSEFLKIIDHLQKKGGILFTIHDPAHEVLKSEVYQARCEDYMLNSHQKTAKLSLVKRAVNKIKRLLQPQDYITAINKTLLNKGIINQPLTAKELWSVTDIHVEGLPYSANDGISKQMLTTVLSSYRLISYRTYSFFGTLNSNLTKAYQKKEQQLSLQGDLNGRNFGSVWLKKNSQ